MQRALHKKVLNNSHSREHYEHKIGGTQSSLESPYNSHTKLTRTYFSKRIVGGSTRSTVCCCDAFNASRDVSGASGCCSHCAALDRSSSTDDVTSRRSTSLAPRTMTSSVCERKALCARVKALTVCEVCWISWSRDCSEKMRN